MSTIIDQPEKQVTTLATELQGWKRLRLLLYWLAGARWSSLAFVSASERERIAVLGSSVLVPTVLAFLGMYLFVSNRFHEPRPILASSIAVIWALIIMNIDRILMATYRPFQPLFRKVVQISFRIAIAAVVSAAIAFPFCLDQYRGAIKERLRSEFNERLRDVQVREQHERKAFETQDAALLKDLHTQLDDGLTAGPLDPHLYAETQTKQEIRQQKEELKNSREQSKQAKSHALEEWKSTSNRILELTQDREIEAKGNLPLERGGTGRPGVGAKYYELSRELEQAERAEKAAKQKLAVLELSSELEKEISIDDDKRAAYVREGEARKTRIDDLKKTIERVQEASAKHLKDHESRYNPLISSYQSKLEGVFDPMEETLGLFKVIFIPESTSDIDDQTMQKYKWIAALFQFSIIFCTLFLLDLIAILSKVMSRPGSYDVLVEFTENISRQNLIAFMKDYPRFADNWVDNPSIFSAGNNAGVDLRDSEAIARLLLRAHLSGPMDVKAKKLAPIKS